jgi:hypothetical protein
VAKSSASSAEPLLHFAPLGLVTDSAKPKKPLSPEQLG